MEILVTLRIGKYTWILVHIAVCISIEYLQLRYYGTLLCVMS